MKDRRTILRGLASLPLIGGSVAILGEPMRVRAAASNEQLASYAAFCIREADNAIALLQKQGVLSRYRPCDAMVAQQAFFPTPGKVALRAPIVLSAVGCPL